MNAILTDAVVIAFIGGIVSIITTRITTENKKNTESISKHLNRIDDRLSEVQTEVQEVKQIGLDNRLGIQRTQRYRLQEDMEKAISDGYTTPTKLREVSKLFESYTNLGGNGEIQDLHAIYLKLPIKQTEQKGMLKIWHNFKKRF